MRKYIWIIVVLLVCSAVCIFLSIAFYLNLFNLETILSTNEWNTIGTFFGGILSPIFSFFSMLAVLLIFITEMNEKRKDNVENKIIKHIEWLEQSFNYLTTEGYLFDMYDDKCVKRREVLHCFHSTVQKQARIENEISNFLMRLSKMPNKDFDEQNISLYTAAKERFSKIEALLEDLINNCDKFDGLKKSVKSFIDFHYLTYKIINEADEDIRDTYLLIYSTKIDYFVISAIFFYDYHRIERNEDYKNYLIEKLNLPICDKLRNRAKSLERLFSNELYLELSERTDNVHKEFKCYFKSI